MLMVNAIVRSSRASALEELLQAQGYKGLTRTPDRGNMETCCLVVEDDQANQVIRLIHEAAHTGQQGDGKIFVTKVLSVYRIRDGLHESEH